MKAYKYTDATNTVVHVIDEDGISRMSMLASALPEGTVVEPADPPPARDIRAEIAALESQQLLPRVTREFMLGILEAQFTPEQLAENLGYVRLKAFDEEIKAMRALL